MEIVARIVWVARGARVIVLSPTLAVSMHIMAGHSLSPKSAIAWAFALHGFHTTVVSEADFSMNDPKAQSDGSQLIVWSYTANASGGAKVKLLGNSFIEQRADKLSILTSAVPDEQFDTLKPETNTVINSYSIDASAALP